MQNRFWFLLPFLWLAQMFYVLSEPKPEPQRTKFRLLGLVPILVGMFFIAYVALNLLFVPLFSVAAALLGLFLIFVGFALMMTKKKVAD